MRKKVRIFLYSAVAGGSLFCLYLVYYSLKDHTNNLLSRVSPILSTDVTLISTDSSSAVYSIRIDTETLPGLQCFLRVPVQSDRGPFPAIILLGGVNTGRDAIHFVGESSYTDDFIFMTMDYPYAGKKKDLTAFEFIAAIPSIRDAILNSVPAVITMIDYLETREEVDKDQIFTAGASFGIFFTIVSAAIDTRVKATMSFFSAGDISGMIANNIDFGPSFIRKPLGFLSYLLLLPVEPLNYIDRIVPRHFLMVNGRDDDRVPQELVEKLYNKAGEPKELIWLDADHFNTDKEQLIAQITGIAVNWLAKNGLVEIKRD